MVCEVSEILQAFDQYAEVARKGALLAGCCWRIDFATALNTAILCALRLSQWRGWVAAPLGLGGGGDGVLFSDADGDGKISDRREYVFTDWAPGAGDDMEALRQAFDSNGDGEFKRLISQHSTHRKHRVLTSLLLWSLLALTPPVSAAQEKCDVIMETSLLRKVLFGTEISLFRGGVQVAGGEISRRGQLEYEFGRRANRFSGRWLGNYEIYYEDPPNDDRGLKGFLFSIKGSELEGFHGHFISNGFAVINTINNHSIIRLYFMDGETTYSEASLQYQKVQEIGNILADIDCLFTWTQK